MNSHYLAVAELLLSIEHLLREQGIWSHRPPSAQQLASTMPFAVDTLDFEDWLQFIFLPQMQELLRRQLPLPAHCAITPAAEMAFIGRQHERKALLVLLAQFDELLRPTANHVA